MASPVDGEIGTIVVPVLPVKVTRSWRRSQLSTDLATISPTRQPVSSRNRMRAVSRRASKARPSHTRSMPSRRMTGTGLSSRPGGVRPGGTDVDLHLLRPPSEERSRLLPADPDRVGLHVARRLLTGVGVDVVDGPAGAGGRLGHHVVQQRLICLAFMADGSGTLLFGPSREAVVGLAVATEGVPPTAASCQTPHKIGPRPFEDVLQRAPQDVTILCSMSGVPPAQGGRG